MKTENGSGLPGATTLLSSFVSVVLAVFAMLSLSQAQADARRAKAMADGTAAWYAADAGAQKTLASLRTGNVPDNVRTVGPGAYAWTAPVDKTKHIETEVRILPGGAYETYRWQMTQNEPWAPERSPYDDVAKP